MQRSMPLTKIAKLATLAFQNVVRLHYDAILMFQLKRYPTAYYLSIIAMEEMAKTWKLEDHYFYSLTGSRRNDVELEKKIITRLYDHKYKQLEFVGRDFPLYSPRYYRAVETRKLDLKKLGALYVGLPKRNGKVDLKGRINNPENVNANIAKQQISILNGELKNILRSFDHYEYHFSIEEMDFTISSELTREILKGWKYRSGMKSQKWLRQWEQKRKLNAKASVN